MRILSFWFVTYFIVKVASFVGHLFEGERSFFYVGGCYSLVLCWSGSHFCDRDTFFWPDTYSNPVRRKFIGLITCSNYIFSLWHLYFCGIFFFTLAHSYLIFFKNNFKICFCVKDFFFHFICNGFFGLLWPTTYFLLKDSVFDLQPLSVDIPLLTITNYGSHN